MRNRIAVVVTLTVVGLVLYLAGIIGVAYLAGFHAVWRHLTQPDPPWAAACFVGVVISWLGYYIAFEGLARVPGGPELSGRERISTVAAGFGSFLYKGGSEVDNFAMKRGGADPHIANVRVSTLKSLEHAPIAIGTWITAIILLSLGRTDPPPLDFTWPWATAPVVGAAIAILLAARYRERLRNKKGFFQSLGTALEGIWMLRELAVGSKSRGMPFIGMVIFWAGDVFALWSALITFSGEISFGDVVVAYAVGYVLTRRSAPLGGAGLIELILPLTLWDCGASFAGAVAAVAVFRFFSLWVPLPAAFISLPTVRSIGDGPMAHTPEPALQDSR